jgi:hypothetical protein
MDEGRCLVYRGYQQLHEPVYHIFVVVIITDLESVVEKYVGCEENSSNSEEEFFASFLYPITLDTDNCRSGWQANAIQMWQWK